MIADRLKLKVAIVCMITIKRLVEQNIRNIRQVLGLIRALAMEELLRLSAAMQKTNGDLNIVMKKILLSMQIRVGPLAC